MEMRFDRPYHRRNVPHPVQKQKWSKRLVAWFLKHPKPAYWILCGISLVPIIVSFAVTGFKGLVTGEQAICIAVFGMFAIGFLSQALFGPRYEK